ncbi:MAG: hypothetical protein AAGE94_04380 [Acidobacteriota bacterium]
MARRLLVACLLPWLALASGAPAQQDADTDGPIVGHAFGFEVKAHYRDSEAASFPFPFPFPEVQPLGFLETVEPGDHFEISTATVFWKGAWGDEGLWSGKAKIDMVERYDGNPTSTDDEVDIDELWLRWGREVEPGEPMAGHSVYAKLGRFPKFERQNDRHLESYGLLSTAFNRQEDVGLEVGFGLADRFIVKASFTQGNPVFIRDPNALAGDNGTASLLSPDGPELTAGIPILYDADTDEIDFDEPEVGLGLGVRFGDSDFWSLDLLLFAYERDLQDTVEFDGTFYGGDLDILLGPFNAFPLPGLDSRTKEEWGFNAWLYAGSMTGFFQYVDQDLGGLERTGFEIELSYDWELPYLGAVWGRQVLPWIAPAVRYSELDPDFAPGPHPTKSVAWDWEKIDLGVRMGLIQGLADLTLEYAQNDFVRGGVTESADEFLATLRLQWGWEPSPAAF